MYPLCYPQPLCIHGNSWLLGSTTGHQQWLNQTGCWSSLWETYFNLCLLLTNLSGDSSWIVSLLYWNKVPWARFLFLLGVVTIFSSVAWVAKFSCQWLFVFWQCLTIIHMVRPIVILHSLAEHYVVCCFLWVLLSKFSHTYPVYSCLHHLYFHRC